MNLKKYINLITRFILEKLEIFILVLIIFIVLLVVYSYFLFSDKTSRDASRYVNLLKINDELKIYYSKNNIYPIPEQSVNIESNGLILTYQGYFGEETFKKLSIDPIKDPLNNEYYKYLNYYTYAIDSKKQKFQLMGFYEFDEKGKYLPLKTRKPFNYGEQVGIALENINSRPIQETKLSLDILKTKDNYTIYLDNNQILKGNKDKLKIFISDTKYSKAKSCLDIKNAGINKSGFYYINPLLNSAYSKFGKTLKVYCDLKTDGGGWTRLYYKKGKETCFNDDNSYNSFIIDKLFTNDFAVSDNLYTLNSEGSWIVKNVDFKDISYSTKKMSNIANCKTPSGNKWNIDYGNNYIYYHNLGNGNIIRELKDYSGLIKISGVFSTYSKKGKVFYGCDLYKKNGENIFFQIGGFEKHTGLFIHGICNNYSKKDNSITSRWDFDKSRVIWIR